MDAPAARLIGHRAQTGIRVPGLLPFYPLASLNLPDTVMRSPSRQLLARIDPDAKALMPIDSQSAQYRLQSDVANAIVRLRPMATEGFLHRERCVYDSPAPAVA